MEREAFARARRFLNYSPVAKWSALIAAVSSGILYVALLVVLGLFVDLVVSRGVIPSFRDLSPAEKEYFWQHWAALSLEDRQKALQDSGVEDAKQAANLAAADPQGMTPADQELRCARACITSWTNRSVRMRLR